MYGHYTLLTRTEVVNALTIRLRHADGVPCIYLCHFMKYYIAVARCRTNSTKQQSIILLIFMLELRACTLIITRQDPLCQSALVKRTLYFL